MKLFSPDKPANILLFNAPTRDEARRIRRELLEKRLIRGAFIVPVDAGYMDDDGNIIEGRDYFVVFAHCPGSLTPKALETLEAVSDSFGLTWELKSGTDNYAEWLYFL